MSIFIPDMYVKDIFSINYNKLKKLGIKALLFDFDNTLIEHGNYKVDKKLIELIESLKKDFTVIVVSNSIHNSKLKLICNELNLFYIGNSGKPFKRGFKKLNLNLKEKEIAMIGDQLITDIWGAKRMGYFSILIDPISYHEIIFTKFNRLLEKIIFKTIKKKRGNYYD